MIRLQRYAVMCSPSLAGSGLTRSLLVLYFEHSVSLYAMSLQGLADKILSYDIPCVKFYI